MVPIHESDGLRAGFAQQTCGFPNRRRFGAVNWRAATHEIGTSLRRVAGLRVENCIVSTGYLVGWPPDGPRRSRLMPDRRLMTAGDSRYGVERPAVTLGGRLYAGTPRVGESYKRANVFYCVRLVTSG